MVQGDDRAVDIAAVVDLLVVVMGERVVDIVIGRTEADMFQ